MLGASEEFTTRSFGIQLLCFLCLKAVQNLQPFVGSGGPPSPKVPFYLGSKIPCPPPALGWGEIDVTSRVLVSGCLLGPSLVLFPGMSLWGV